MIGAVTGDRSVDRCQHRVHGSVDGPTEAAGKKLLRNGCHDADVGLGPDQMKRLLDGLGPGAVDDLGSLHHFA